jgi:hypothetical protein
MVAFLITVAGYGCAAVFAGSAFLKPMFPSRIGLWLQPHNALTFGYWDGRGINTEVYGVSVQAPASFVLGTLGPTDGPVKELLGPWLVPIGIVFGVFLLLGTTVFVRWFIRRFGNTGGLQLDWRSRTAV